MNLFLEQICKCKFEIRMKTALFVPFQLRYLSKFHFEINQCVEYHLKDVDIESERMNRKSI